MIEQPPTADMQTPHTFGQRLTSSREALGLNRKDAASQLRLPERVITMLETGDIEVNLPMTFLRGYIRSYSKFLAIPELEIQTALDNLSPQPETDHAPINLIDGISRPLSSGNSGKLGNFFVGLFKYLVGFALIALIGISLFTYKTNTFQLTPATPQPIAEMAATAPTDSALSTDVPNETTAAPVHAEDPTQSAFLPFHVDTKKILGTIFLAAAITLLGYLYSNYASHPPTNASRRLQQNLFIKQPRVSAKITRFFNVWVLLMMAIVMVGIIFLGINRASLPPPQKLPLVATHPVHTPSSASKSRINLTGDLKTLAPLSSLNVLLAAEFKTYALSPMIHQLQAYLATAETVKFALTDPSTELGHHANKRMTRYHARRNYVNSIPPYYRYDHVGE